MTVRKTRVVRAICFIFGLLLITSSAGAQREGFGLGFIIGEPTGVSGKLWVNQTAAIVGAAAWSFRADDAFHVHVDALVHSFNVFGEPSPQMPVFYGLGARVKLGEDDSWLGLRVPLGVCLLFEDAPLDLFFEVAPLMDLLPDTEFRINAALGIRYFFGAAKRGSRKEQARRRGTI